MTNEEKARRLVGKYFDGRRQKGTFQMAKSLLIDAMEWKDKNFRKAMEAVIKENLTPEYDAEYLQSKIDAFTEARRKDGKTADEMLDDCRGGALELTWQDVKRIVNIADEILRRHKDSHGVLWDEERYYKEVLKLFRED